MPTYVKGAGGGVNSYVGRHDEDEKEGLMLEMRGGGGGGFASGKTSPATTLSPSSSAASSASSPVAAYASAAVLRLGDPAAAAIVSCFTYTFCSITMVLANKALASGYKADIDFLVIAFQSVCAVALVLGCDLAGVIPQGSTHFDKKVALQWLPVNVFFVAMLSTGFLSLKHLNVPMVTIFKNLTNVGIMWGEWKFHGAYVSTGAIVSCAIMILGAVLAAANDITFSAVGYFWMVMNCLCTAGYVLYMKHATQTVRLPKFGMVFYNNLLSLPILLTVAALRGEYHAFFATPALHTAPYLTLSLYAGMVGFFLNLATLWCVSNNSATTYAVVGALNKIPLALLGWFLFKTPITNKALVFLSMSMCGGFLYTYTKLREADRPPQSNLPR